MSEEGCYSGIRSFSLTLMSVGVLTYSPAMRRALRMPFHIFALRTDGVLSFSLLWTILQQFESIYCKSSYHIYEPIKNLYFVRCYHRVAQSANDLFVLFTQAGSKAKTSCKLKAVEHCFVYITSNMTKQRCSPSSRESTMAIEMEGI